MGVRGIISFFFRRGLEISIVLALIALFPNLPPFVSIKEPFRVEPSRPLEGRLALKESFDDVQIWHKGDFVGPEAFADLNGELYTTIHGGDVVKLTGEHITPVVKFGKPCKGLYEEAICGRPLGITFDKNGYLYAADAYYGLYKVDLKTGVKQQLVSPTQKVGGRSPMLFNSVTVASNGDIFWTDSSTDFTLENGVYVLLADPSGRLIHYDSKTKKNTVLIDKLHFANGVILSDDEEFVLVAETVRSRIHRYYLKGPKKGVHDIFIDGLPGLPDNITPDGKGGFIVPLIFGRDDSYPALYQSIGPLPWIRKVVARLMGIAEYLLDKLNHVYPTEFGAKCVHFIGHFASIPLYLQNTRMTILRLNKNGEIIDSIHCLNGKIKAISEAYIFRDILYLGSPFNDYLAKIPLSKLGWDDLKVNVVKRAAPSETVKEKPVPKVTETTTPKPTTTTPKPTTTTAKPATTTTPKPATTTTPKPTTTTPKPATTTTQKPTTTDKPTQAPSQPPKTTRPAQAPTTTPKPTTKTTPVTPKPTQAPKPVKEEGSSKSASKEQEKPKTNSANGQQKPPTANQKESSAKNEKPSTSNSKETSKERPTSNVKSQ